MVGIQFKTETNKARQGVEMGKLRQFSQNITKLSQISRAKWAKRRAREKFLGCLTRQRESAKKGKPDMGQRKRQCSLLSPCSLAC